MKRVGMTHAGFDICMPISFRAAYERRQGDSGLNMFLARLPVATSIRMIRWKGRSVTLKGLFEDLQRLLILLESRYG